MRTTGRFVRQTGIALLCLILSLSSFAQWNSNPAINNAITTTNIKSCSQPWLDDDGSGGYFIIWEQVNNNQVYGTEIYAQHIDVSGRRLWPDTGVLICDAKNFQLWPIVMKDGKGGAFFVWQDQRDNFANDLYMQHATGDGTLLWAKNGALLSGSYNQEAVPQMVSDEQGGAIVTWSTSVLGTSTSHIFAQRFAADGTLLWNPNGVPVCIAPDRQETPHIIPDHQGGAYISWEDYRANGKQPDVYAQRLRGDGTPVWATNGIPVCTAPYDQVDTRLADDGQGGAIIAWRDFRASYYQHNKLDIYAQRIRPDGSMVWATNGAAVCTQDDVQFFPDVITDGQGGAIVTWADERNNGYAIYAQRIGVNGSPLWAKDGIPVCTKLQNRYTKAPLLVSDDHSGAVITWQDDRDGDITNIYTQRISLYGGIEWTEDGAPVSIAPGTQYFNQDGLIVDGGIKEDGAGGAVIAWTDARNSTDAVATSDIYAAKTFGPPPMPKLKLISDQCTGSVTAKTKLVNPPTYSSISVKLDGADISYSQGDSGFIYFASNATQKGKHTIAVTYTNTIGAVTKDTSFVVSETVTPAVSISALSSICTGTPVLFTATPVTAGAAPLFAWTINGQDIHEQASSFQSSALQNGDVIKCGLTVTDASLHCLSAPGAESNPITMTVTDRILPTLSLIAPANEICPHTPASFTASVSGGNNSTLGYQWKVNGKDEGTGSVFTNDDLKSGDQVYCILSVTTSGCTDAVVPSDTVTLKVSDVPVVSLYPKDTVVSYGSQVQIKAIVTGNQDGFTWSPAQGLSGVETLHPVTMPLQETAGYTLTVHTPEGCTVTQTTTITVFTHIAIPSAFSPNGDGRNDMFRIPPHTLKSLARFAVFNRYGDRLFETTDPATGWNGRDKHGTMLQTGTYVYLVEGTTFSDKKVILKGTVSLLQ